MSRAAGGAPGGCVLAHPVDDIERRGAGAEDSLESHLLELWQVLMRDDPPTEEDHIVDPPFLQLFHHSWEQLQVCAGEDGEPDDVRVLLECRLSDHLRRLPDARIDDLEAGVAEGSGDDFGAAVMSIEAGLGDNDLYLAFLSHLRGDLL